jgi:hypothetical protein
MPNLFAPPVAANVLVLPPGEYQYTQLANQALGNAGDPSDGFEAAFSLASGAINALAELGKARDVSVDTLTRLAAASNDINLPDLTRDIAAATRDSGFLLDQASGALALLGNAPSLPGGLSPPPPPPLFSAAGIGSSTGGGIGGGLTAAASGGGLAAVGLGAIGTASSLGWLPTSLGALAAGPVGIAIVAGVALAALFAHFLGGGCGAPCIDAAKAEQIYEAAADNLYNVAKAGLLGKADAIKGMQQLISMGQKHESNWTTEQARNGSADLTRVISAEITAAGSLPTAATHPLTLAAARTHYVGGQGWYPDALSAAAQLTDTFLEQLGAK